MARYCFYCGRELMSGEKCGCRSAGSSAAQAGPEAGKEQQPTDGSTKARGSTAAKPKRNVFQRFIQYFNPFAAPEPAGARPGSGRGQPGKTRPSYRPTGPGATVRPPSMKSLLAGLGAMAAYLRKPADSIRLAAQAGSRSTVFFILLLQGVCGGIFLLSASSKAILRAVLSLNVASSAGNGSFLSGLFIFMQGFGINLGASLLLVLLYQLALRYLFRQPTGFMRLLASFAPSFFYYTIFLLLALLTLPASLFSAGMMMLTGFVTAGLAQYLALRQLLAFDENRVFILLTFVVLVYTGILALFLNLSLPALSALLGQTVII